MPSAGSYSDGTKITTIIKDTILDDYEDGISNATVTVCCDDFYNASGTKVIDWSKGETLQVGQVVFFTEDKYNNGNQRYWRITGRKFYWEGAPYCDLELQENKFLPDGLYQNGTLVYSYQDLIDNGYLVVQDGVLTSFDLTLTGTLRLSSAPITEIAQWAFFDVNNYVGSQLSAVILPEGLTTIGDEAFSYNYILENVYLPNSLTEVGYDVFTACIALTNVNIPTNLSTISYGMFSGTKISNITIPKSVQTIQIYAFNPNSSIGTITMESRIPPTLVDKNAIPDEVTAIYIPAGTLSAYQNATNWSYFFNKFVEVGGYYNEVENNTLYLSGAYSATNENGTLTLR